MGIGRTKKILACVLIATAVVFAPLIATRYAKADEVPVIHRIVFPVEGKSSYSNDFGSARTGHTHQGNDIIAGKMQKALAAVSGTITWIRYDNGTAGNFIQLSGDDGWKYWYMHLNNDTPGTDDGANNPAYYIAPGLTVGKHVSAGEFIAYVGDSGNAEGTVSHLHFEMHEPDGTVINPYWNLRLSQGKQVADRCGFDTNPATTPSSASGSGYWILGNDGGVFSYGSAKFYGSMGGQPLNKPIVGMASMPDGKGYYLVASDGGIFSFGSAQFRGSMGGQPLNKPIVGMTVTPTGNGYWMVASDGGIFSFGDARFYGSTGSIKLNQPVIGMTTTTSGAGYWLYARDGGIFTFGNARFLGSSVSYTSVNAASMEPTPSGNGYWIMGVDGAIYSFGDAQYKGGLPGFGYCKWAGGADLLASATGGGYWTVAVDATVWSFGDAKYYGSPREQNLAVRPISIVAS